MSAELRSEYVGVHIPCGCSILVGDDEDSLVDIGVIPEETDSSLSITYEVQTVMGSKREKVLEYVRNMAAEGTSAIYQVKLKTLNDLLGGVMDIEESEGSNVPSATHKIAKGYAKETVYTLPGQNADGSAQTISKVNDGTEDLTDGVDYVQAKGADGSWDIMLLSAATATEELTVTYSYTPAAYVDAYMGDSVRKITPKMIRFYKEYGGKKFWVDLYSAKVTNGLQIGFPAASADTPMSIPLTISGELDTSRVAGKQLLRIHDEIGVGI